MNHNISIWISEVRFTVDENVSDRAKYPVVRVVQVVIEKRQVLTLAAPDHASAQIKRMPPGIFSSAVCLM